MYQIVQSILRRIFPDHWVNKDTAGAVMGIVGVSLILIAVCALLFAMSGCYGGRLYAEYEHHSSVPFERDLNTSDQVGGCVAYGLGVQKYAPNMEVCLHVEVTDKKVFGDDPVGTVRVQQPFYMWGRR